MEKQDEVYYELYHRLCGHLGTQIDFYLCSRMDGRLRHRLDDGLYDRLVIRLDYQLQSVIGRGEVR